MTKKRSMCVWFNQDEQEIFNKLEISQPLKDFVRAAFYEKIDNIRPCEIKQAEENTAKILKTLPIQPKKQAQEVQIV